MTIGEKDYWPEGALNQAEIAHVLKENKKSAIFLQRFWPIEKEIPQTIFSYLGGLPMLPKSVAWPLNPYSGFPLHFLCQINCSEMPKIGSKACLPETGFLYFFADINEDMLWEDFGVKNFTRVIYSSENVGNLLERALPESLPEINHETYKSSGQFSLIGQRKYPKWPLIPHVVDVFKISNNNSDKRCNSAYRQIAGEITYSQIKKLAPVSKKGQSEIYDVSISEYLRQKDLHNVALIAKLIMQNCIHYFALKRDLLSNQHYYLSISKSDEQSIRERLDSIESVRKCYIELVLTAFEIFSEFHSFNDCESLCSEKSEMFLKWIDFALETNFEISRVEQLGIQNKVKDIIIDTMHFISATAVSSPEIMKFLPKNFFQEFSYKMSPFFYGDHKLLGEQSSSEDFIKENEILLLQLVSDPGMGFKFCDAGVINFWISEKDLKALNFEEAYALTSGG